MRTLSTVKLLVVAAGSLGLLGSMTVLAASSSWRSSGLRQSPLPAPLAALELQDLLSRSGLTPENLAAAGFTAQESSALVSRAADRLQETLSQWRSAQTTLENAQKNLVNLRPFRQPADPNAAPSSQPTAEAISSAVQTQQTAKAALDGQLETTRTFILAQTDAGKVATLNHLRTNANREVPVQYRVVERTDAQWVQLRDALSSLRLSTKWGSPEDSQARSTVVDADAQAAVASAKGNLENRKPEVQQAMETAVSNAVRP
jgi:hypothetical protein